MKKILVLFLITTTLAYASEKEVQEKTVQQNKEEPTFYFHSSILQYIANECEKKCAKQPAHHVPCSKTECISQEIARRQKTDPLWGVCDQKKTKNENERASFYNF